MGTLALISLGSNLGDRKARMESAVATLSDASGVIVRATSSFHETPPIGGPGGQGAFLNAAVALETTLEPPDLLSLLHSIEHRAGRLRTVRWGERTLDLDLLLYGDRRIHTGGSSGGGPDANGLIVPHPRLAVRRFVLAPLAEIAPDAIEPCSGRTVERLLANLDRRPSLVALHHRCPSRESVFLRLVPELSAVGLYYGTRPARDGAALRAWHDRRCRELRDENWPAATWRDRWLVTDVWFEELSRGEPPTSDWGSQIQDEFSEARKRLIIPTFVVVPLSSGLPPPTSDFPTLWLDSDGVESVAEEVASACRASRAGYAS